MQRLPPSDPPLLPESPPWLADIFSAFRKRVFNHITAHRCPKEARYGF